MKLYIVRHGETPWNVKFKLQGTSDIPLNEKGILAAEKTGEALQEVPFDICYTSPLQRAKETAGLILRGRDIPIIEDERIQEITFGVWEGRCCRPDAMEIPGEMLDNFFHHTERYQPPEGGERISDVVKRTRDFFLEMIHRSDYEEKTILIASHGCAVRALLQNVYPRGDDFWHGKVPPNCGVNIVEAHKGVAKLIVEDAVYC
ncbi:histidine phosphatase family protein [Lactonifactor longoviformis]|uniref:phosphoglycerate mutase (2,3-diphosphoglycerate-dependent) n=1 Tax=Lactonifactor longoviformis DSM 17459 TaxID=1122155 RepID=A0A1M4WXY2_9CLOT|nr:histidine phosphatase family protein [Lactonifactor longoviformis]POP34036.1 histidine phosphatase family protein [Lactonifactor longoviformis]SHE86068.1 probable phosphoglycerate mutase [Lactonifactor longoviformis DSM 17459]